MRPEERDAAYLWDMLEAGRAVVDFTENFTLQEFLAATTDREITRLAVERELEILGEAGRRVSARFQADHPEIAWHDIIGLRNVISHEYDKVNYEEIYRIARERVPELIARLEALVPPLPDIGEKD
jgi:uncharacterized protein with HEPN domain